MKKFTLFIVFAIVANLVLSSVTSAQIAQRGVATSASSTTTSITISKPAGVVSGDVMLVNIAQGGNNSTNPLLAGWTIVDGRSLAGGTARYGAVLYRVADGTEGASFTFTLGAGVDAASGSIVAFSGVSPSGVKADGSAGGPFDVDPGTINLGGSNSTTATGLTITTATANAAVIMFAESAGSPPSWSAWTTATSPGALTELYDNPNSSGTQSSVGAAWAIKAAAGATGDGTATLSTGERNGGILVALKAINLPSASLTPSSTQSILTGGTVNFTATANNYAGSGNYSYTWTAAGATIPVPNPASVAGNTNAKTLTFPTAGTFTVSVSVARTGEGTHVTNTVTVKVFDPPASPNLFATSSSGTQVSSFSVVNGIYIAGPVNIFDPTIGGTVTATAALGISDKPSVANGTFYWLPNTGTNGVVTVYAATHVGGSPTNIGSFDVNGASTNSLGFVRLGMGPDGTGWILAGDGTTLFLAKFIPNGTALLSSLPAANQLQVVDASVSLVGGTVATFQNGDVCVLGNGDLYALANDGSGVTQIFIGAPNGASTTLTKKWDLVDPNNVPFSGTVNGVAFDLLGSLYISTGDGLYFIDQSTVNGPAGTVECSLVHSVTGLQDLASNFFPAKSSLPIQLGSFTVSKQGNNAILDWLTQTELNSDHFEIERSYDGINFTRAGNKQAAGNSVSSISYQYIDPIMISSGNIYYRLKTVDIDGKSTYSKIVVLRLNGGSIKDFTVYPNPFTSDLKLQISSDKETAVTIRISNALGQPVVSKNVTLQKGDNIIVLSSELQNLKPGMHLMEIITEDGKLTQKIIKR